MSSEAWQKFLKGDESSFSELYSKYFKELFAYGLKLDFNQEVCKDAIQDVFYTIYISRNKLTHIKNIEFYLLHCLKNRLFDIYKEQIKINKITYEDTVLESEQNIVEQIIKTEKQLQIQDQITQLLKNLSPQQRKIIYFRYNLNLSYTEIGSLLDMNPDSVKKSIQRALKKMKKIPSNFRIMVLLFATTVY